MTDDKPERLKHVEVDEVGFGAKRVKDQFLVLLFGILLATVTGIPATIWVGSRTVTRLEMAIDRVNENLSDSVAEMRLHIAQDDARTEQMTEAIQSIDKTMTRVVVNQENLQSRVQRLERLDDQENRN